MNVFQEKLKNMTDDAFIHLGEQQVVYIKPVIKDGISGFAVHAASGRELAILETHEEALVAAFENELIPARIH